MSKLNIEQQIAVVKTEIEKVQKVRNVLITCGLKKEADERLNDLANLNIKLDKLRSQMKELNKQMLTSMVKMIMQTDLAYAQAINFRELYSKVGKSAEPLVALIEEIVKNCHDLVQIVDDLGMERLSTQYCLMTEHLDDVYKDTVDDLVDSVYDKYISIT